MTRSMEGQPVPLPTSGPLRRAGRGGKLRIEAPELQAHLIAGAWLKSASSNLGDEAMDWGLIAARAGRVRTLEIGSGMVSASVSEEGESGRRVTLSVPVLTDIAWRKVIAAMASEAVYTARFKDGEFPANLPQLFSSCGVSLVPAPEEVIGIRTNAPDGSARSRAASVAWLLAERLVVEPLAILEIRGQVVSNLVERIRQMRSLQLSEGAVAHPMVNMHGELEPPTPLGEEIEQYWRIDTSFEQAGQSVPTQHIQHALLRRLGPSPMDGKFPLSGLLATIYDLISDRSKELLDGEETP